MGIFNRFSQACRLIRLSADLNRGVKDLAVIEDIDRFLEPHRQALTLSAGTATLDIGCGGRPRNPFQATESFGIDIRGDGLQNIRYADLTVEAIPFDSDSFDFVTAYDFLEHVPRVVYAPQRRFAFVELMNEVWRVLKPKGHFLSSTPMFPFSEAFRDPTHVNFISHETFPMYFDDKNRWAAMYGFRGSFEVIAQVRREWNLVTLLRKSKSES